MEPEQASENPRRRPPVLQQHQESSILHRLMTLNIGGKIILPYLILTLVVAVVGIYVVTNLVASSLDERLTNQLLEAGRVVSDGMARQEIDHLESARAIAFTTGLAEALEAGDQDSVTTLAQPAASVRGVECLIVTDAQGQEMLHVLQQEDGSFEHVEGQFDISTLWIIQTLLDAGDPNEPPKRSLVLHQINEHYYYFTALPVERADEAVGVVAVGTSLNTLLPHLKTTSLADVTIYLNNGRAIASTFTLAEHPSDTLALLDELSITSDLYEEALNTTDYTIGKNVRVRGRPYRLAHGPLRVGNDNLGVFAVALPSNFIIQAGTTSRNTYALIFFAATISVILIGYLISQRITHPLNLLVQTSQAVAEGDLTKRSGITRADEIGTLATTFDMMTGRLAERTRELEEALGRMQSILSSIGDGVILEDTEGNFITLNQAAEDMLEVMAENFTVGPLHEVSVGDLDTLSDSQSAPWLVDRRRFTIGEKVISTNSATVQTKDGEHLGTVIVLRDVTTEAEAEQLKDAFITHVSHELRTPLTAIKGYSELLLASIGDTIGEEKRDFLTTIRRHTDSLMMMVNALLDFSEMEAWGRLGIRQRATSLYPLVQDIADNWRPQMEQKGLAFKVEEPGSDLSQVNADVRRLRCAIVNVVRNALQYTPPGGSVTLRLSESDGQLTLEVVDTGVGISPEDLDQLFSRFYRVTQAANTPDEDVRGLGLGLYVSQAIVEAHNGEIRVDSEEGVGSKFSIILPTLQSQDETTS